MFSLVVVLSGALAACGCFGGGDGGGRSARFGKKNGNMAQKNQKNQKKAGKKQQPRKNAAPDYSDMTPELSMRQGYDALKETETRQVRIVSEMRQALAQGEEAIQIEERKLAQIRTKIADFEVAMGRYNGPQGGGRPAGNRPARRNEEQSVVPASFYTDTRSAGPDSRARVPHPSSYANRPAPAPAGYADGGYERRQASYQQPRDDRYAGREETLYDSRGGYREPQLPARRDNYAPGYQSQPQPQPREQRYAPAGNGWEAPGRLYSDAQPRPGRAAPVANTLRPEPRIAAPASLNMDVSVPAAGATTQPRQQVRPAEQPEARAEYPSDEVFTPDLYLSGGR